MEKLCGHEYMKVGCNCAQAVLVSLAAEVGLTREMAMKISCPFGGGCRAGEVCGAVTGALMAIGMATGNTDWADKETRQRSDARTVEFNRRFREKFGDMTCRALVGADTSTPEGKAYFQEHPEIRTQKCFPMVDEAVAIAREIIAQSRQ